MNEYWQSEDELSFCLCCDDEWYQIQCNEDSEWIFCPVTMEQGLPSDMQENHYEECDLATMLECLHWTEAELKNQIAAQLNTTD